MAVTKIWKVKGKAKNAINYADDPDKVIGTMYADDIKDVLNYADNGDKTETHMFTTSLNCTREFAAEEFELTKELFDKHNGIVAVHATQSFEETDISPQEAHEIGVQLARELWGDRFQVIIATHLNTDHVHNHFVINSVSFIDGKKFHLTNYCWHDMAEASDRICKEHGLSVIEKPKGKHMNYAAYKKEKNGDPGYKNIAREALNRAIGRSLNFEEFKAELRAMDFSFRFDPNRKHWTITLPDGKKPIRVDGLGPEFSKESIMERIYSNDSIVRAKKYQERCYRMPNNYRMKKRIHRINTRTGLEKLYLRVCYEMGYLPKYRQDPLRVSYIFRDELIYPEWLEYKSLHTSAHSTITRINNDWNRFYKGTEIALIPLRKLTKLKLDSWAHYMIKEHKMDKTLYYNFSGIMRQCLDYAVDKQIVDENVFRKVRIDGRRVFTKKRKKPSETQVYSREELAGLRELALADYNNRIKTYQLAPLAVLFQFETGVRIGEVCVLRYEDIDGQYLHVRRMLRRDIREVVEHTKGGREERSVILTSEAKEIIKKCKKRQKELGVESDGYIFSVDGEYCSYYAISDLYRKYCDKLGIPLKSSHKSRKTFISILLDANMNANTVREMVGHADERTTLQSYHFDRKTEDERIKMMEAALSAARE